MSEEAKAEELVGDLRDAFAANIRVAVKDLPAHHALQLADTLCAVWLDRLQGLRVTHRSRPPIAGDAIAESWAQGRSVEEIIAIHKCSRRTAYNYHPSKAKRSAKTG